MTKEKAVSRRVPDEQTASPEEVKTAFDALTRAETVALQKYASWRVIHIGVAAHSRTYHDLLSEAFEAIFTPDRRRWNKDRATFYTFLKGVIRSISSNWAAKHKRQQTFLDSEETTLTKAGVSSPLDEAPARPEDRDRAVLAAGIKRMLEDLVADHPARQQVLIGWELGMTRSEIQRECGITKQEYDAARQWIYRARRKLAAELNPDE